MLVDGRVGAEGARDAGVRRRIDPGAALPGGQSHRQERPRHPGDRRQEQRRPRQDRRRQRAQPDAPSRGRPRPLRLRRHHGLDRQRQSSLGVPFSTS